VIKLSSGKREWQIKARQLKADTDCHCWFCLRAVGITPNSNSHESHRRSILSGSPVYRTDNGDVT